MPEADIGANGWIWVAKEATYGTALDPTVDDTVGYYVPIISETLAYTEPNRYYSPQIRQNAMMSDVKQSAYHVAGDIVMEIDARWMPLFMEASRHTTVKTGAGPYNYASVPASKGAIYPAGTGLTTGLSIAVVRDGVGFLYSGCVVSNWAGTLDNSIARVTLTMMGLAEADFGGALSTPAWVAPLLYGDGEHAVFVDTAGAAPTFASSDLTFNGFNYTINHNADPQNRITHSRGATYIKFGETEVLYDTELDFLDKTEYTNFKNATKRAVKFESTNAGASWGSATRGFRVTLFNTVYNTYETHLTGMADLVMARVQGRALSIAGGNGYKLECISPTNVA